MELNFHRDLKNKTMGDNSTTIKPKFSVFQIFSLSMGFLGIQFGYALQNANASRILLSFGANMEKAYQMFVRTTRIDLDDYNNDVSEGLHITSMAGSWLAIVDGFAGMRVVDNKLHFIPRLPKKWNSYSFNIHFRGNQFNIRVEKERMIIQNIDANEGDIVVNSVPVTISGNEEKVISI